jgi:hypothetical protein
VRVRVDIYSSPTIDLVGGLLKPGGPGFYAIRALSLLEDVEFEARLFGCGRLTKESKIYLELFDEVDLEPDTPIVFEINVHSDGTRTLKVRSHCSRARFDAYAGDIAIVSPTYWDVSFSSICRLTGSYNVVVIDLQGFTRLDDGRVRATTMFVEGLPCRKRDGSVIRASIEDVGLEGAAKLLTLIDVLTFNGPLILANDDSNTYIIKPLRLLRDVATIGAGDAYDIFLGLALYKGYGIAEAALVAHAATVNALLGRRMRFDQVSREANREANLTTVPRRGDFSTALKELL